MDIATSGFCSSVAPCVGVLPPQLPFQGFLWQQFGCNMQWEWATEIKEMVLQIGNHRNLWSLIIQGLGTLQRHMWTINVKQTASCVTECWRPFKWASSAGAIWLKYDIDFPNAGDCWGALRTAVYIRRICIIVLFHHLISISALICVKI